MHTQNEKQKTIELKRFKNERNNYGNANPKLPEQQVNKTHQSVRHIQCLYSKF